MEREYRVVKLKLDVIFKRVFGDPAHEDIITSFVSALLEIPPESIKKVIINNVELAPEIIDQKFSRLDLCMHVDDRIVNIEMQIGYEPDFADRTLYYWSRLYASDLKSGDEYGDLHQTVCINIINFNYFACEDYHSCFRVMETKRHDILSNKFAIHFFELKKLGKSKGVSPMDDWLRLVNAETEEELMDIMENTSIPEVKKTVVILKELSADEKVRQEAYYREKRLHDEATALGHARREGRAEGRAEGIAEEKKAVAQRLRDMGFTEEQIRKITCPEEQ